MKQRISDLLGIKLNHQKTKQIFNLPITSLGDIIKGTDGAYKQIIKVEPINAELMDDIDIEEVADGIQGALSSYDGRVQIVIQSEKINIERNLKYIEEVESTLLNETKIELLDIQKKNLLALQKNIKNVLKFYMVIEPNEKDPIIAEQLLNDSYINIRNELAAVELYASKLNQEEVTQLLYERLNLETAPDQPLQADWGLDEIMPMTAKRYDDGSHLEVENYIYKHYAVTKFPKEVDKYRWLKKLFRFNDRIFISMTLTPKNKATINKELSNAVVELGAQVEIASQVHVKKSYQEQVDSANKMIDELGADNTHLYDTNITIGICAKDMKQLSRLSSNLISKVSSARCQLSELKYKDFDPFFTTLPILVNNKITNNFVWNLTSRDIASLIPFDSSEFMEDKGTMYGENMESQGLIIVDEYNKIYNNPHCSIVADSGSGKSFWIACHTIRQIPYRDYIIQFDLDGSAKFPWATKYHFDPTSNVVTNPFHIRNTKLTDETNTGAKEVGSFLATKIMDLLTFFTWIIPSMTPTDAALLEEDIRETYEKFGLTFESESLPKTFPTISDLVELMESKLDQGTDKAKISREDMIMAFRPYERGSYARLFNGQTNWDYKEHTILDVSKLPEAAQKPLYELLLKDMWQFCKSHGVLSRMEKRITKKVIIDEIHIFADPNNLQTLKFISTELIKQSRKFGVSVTSATQNLADFIEIGKSGTAIIDNSYFKIFFRLGETDQEIVKKLYKFSDKELKIVKGSTSKGKAGKGKGILCIGSQRLTMQSRATKEELEIIDPVQYEEIYNVKSRYW